MITSEVKAQDSDFSNIIATRQFGKLSVTKFTTGAMKSFLSHQETMECLFTLTTTMMKVALMLT